MSIQSFLFCRGAAKSDAKRDSIIPLPTGVQQFCDISYGPHGKWNLLDVYCPENGDSLPVILNVHGGGYVYGSKEIYKRYCMDLARRGFTVVNINYRLAPKWKFPAPLEDIHAAVIWLTCHACAYRADLSRLFMVGDSAGAQLASQYAAMIASPEYMALFGLKNPGISFRAVGLNCGLYDVEERASGRRSGLTLDYLGRAIPQDDPRLAVLEAIGGNYPPAHITTACHDFLRANAQPMADFLQSKGVEAVCTCYGQEKDKTAGHVFHVNILRSDAIACNDDQCAFFLAHC